MATDFRNRHSSVGDHHVTSVLKSGEVVYDPEDPNHVFTEDEQVLAELGYKSEFKREFTLFTTFSVSFAVLGLLPSFASTLYYGMEYAGTAGMTWGWLIAMIGIQCVALSMAELCSSMPTSGGLYYAAAVLAPPGWGPFAAWVTGWSNWLGQVTAAPSVNYGIGSMILGIVSLNNPNYVPTDAQTYGITAALTITQTFISSLPTRRIAQFNSVGSTFNMLALIVVIILIPTANNRPERGLPKFNSSEDVWGTVYHGTDWSDGVAILMSFVAVIWTMSGYDSPFHLAEECSNANIASPRAIVMSSSIGGSFGWFLQLVVAYTVVSIDDISESDLGQPWVAYLAGSMPLRITNTVVALTIVAGFCMGQGCMVAASRVSFAYARDDVFPCSWFFKRVNQRTRTPVNAVVGNAVIGLLISLLIFGGSVAAGALFSIGAIGAFVSFTIPIFVRVFMVGNRFRQGPWNLGVLSLPIGITACAFVILMIPFLNFPYARGANLDAEAMNWTCLVYGGPMLFIILWWIISARKWFHGPKVNLAHLMLGRDGNLVNALQDPVTYSKEAGGQVKATSGEKDSDSLGS